MIITCPDCEARYNIPDEKIGASKKKATCSKCGAGIAIMPPATGLQPKEEVFSPDPSQNSVSTEKVEAISDPAIQAVQEHYPQFNYLIGSSKSWCSHPDAILFDDHWPNVRKFRAGGGQAFLMPAPWNQDHGQDQVTALKDFLRHKKAVLDASTEPGR